MTPAKHENTWFEAHPRKARWLVFGVCLLFVEVLVRGLVWSGLLPYEHYPTDFTPRFWTSADQHTGRWHLPNANYRHQHKCIDAVYASNSAGMRDPERALSSASPERVVMLGDSVLEGFGVNRGERTSDVLEARTGIEHLNFGVASTGTIQHWLTYQYRARDYEHSRVIVYILPGNDFTDNDPGEDRPGVYRPFLRAKESGYELYYPIDYEQRYTGTQSVPTVVKNTIDNSLYIANVLRWAARLIKGEFRRRRPEPPASDYDRYTPADMEVMLFALDQIVALADRRPVDLVVVPTSRDLEYAAEYGTDFRLISDLGVFAAARPTVRLIDLMPAFLAASAASGRPVREFTLGCDDHWSAAGHRLAATTIFDAVYAPSAQSAK